MGEKKEPFAKFGATLKKMRLSAKDTIDGLSEALELDRRVYSLIEKGTLQPAEDVVTMILSKYKVEEAEALDIWELAGYNEVESDKEVYIENTIVKTQPIMVLPQDLRIVYTDMVHIVVNNYGLTINFMQGGGNGNSPLAVARIGMSIEHAKSVANVINDTLDKHFNAKNALPKSLPPQASQEEEPDK
jgi:transcriptional regulator with XRE-family HTH domain